MLDHTSCDFIVDEFFSKLERYLGEDLVGHTVFFFEDFYAVGGGRGGSGKITGRLKVAGVLEFLLRQSEFVSYAVDTNTCASFLLGKAPRGSKAKKDAVKEWLHNNRNFYTANDNIADAYALAEFGYAYLIEGKKLTCRPLCKLI